MASRSGQIRASGDLAASEEAKQVIEEDSKPIDLPPESQHDLFRTPGFHRMRLDWRGPDREILTGIQRLVDDRVVHNYMDAYALMHEIFEIVRTPQVNEDGERLVDRHGLTLWKQTPSGSWEEDWTRLTIKERDNFLFQITTRLFDWEQRAADAWGEAMFARAQWEERFSLDYDKSMSGTIQDRTAIARAGATEERYFAILVTLFSRKSEAIVRSLSLLGQRLKDSMS